MIVVNTRNSRYLIADGQIMATTGDTILDEVPGAEFRPSPGGDLPAVTAAAIMLTGEPVVGRSFRAVVCGGPFTTSPVVSIERY